MKKIIGNDRSEIFNKFATDMLKRFAQNAPSIEDRVKSHIEVLKKVGQKSLADYLTNKYIKKLPNPTAISIEQLLPAIEIYSSRYGNRSSNENNFLGVTLTDQAKDLIKLTDNSHWLPKTTEVTDPFFAIIANYLKPRLIKKLKEANDPRLANVISAIEGKGHKGFRPGQIERTLLATHLIDAYDIMLSNYLLGLNINDIPDIQEVDILEEKAARADATREELNAAMRAIPQGEPLKNYLNWMLGLFTEQSTAENEPKISGDQFKSGVNYIINLPIAQKLADKLDKKNIKGERATFIYNAALAEAQKELASQKTATRKSPSFWR